MAAKSGENTHRSPGIYQGESVQEVNLGGAQLILSAIGTGVCSEMGCAAPWEILVM